MRTTKAKVKDEKLDGAASAALLAVFAFATVVAVGALGVVAPAGRQMLRPG